MNNRSNHRIGEFVSLFRSVLHNLLVVLVGFGVAFLGSKVDSYLGLASFKSVILSVAAWLFLIGGFLLRVWATFHFYQHQMKVISLEAQNALITSGPYSFSRNPLYLGGNVFIFMGASLVLGSPGGLIITVAHLPLVDLFIRREEKQLEQKFGDEWTRYKERVRRWL